MNNRRHFLQQASRWGLGALGSTLGLYTVNGHSAAPVGYKALVVVHLSGGCDSDRRWAARPKCFPSARTEK